MSRLVSRDPFARQELHVERVYHPAMIARSGANWLYQFWVETDGGRKYIDTDLFCSRECRTDYYYPHEKSDGF